MHLNKKIDRTNVVKFPKTILMNVMTFLTWLLSVIISLIILKIVNMYTFELQPAHTSIDDPINAWMLSNGEDW